jgi:hypothetical protein
MVITPEEFDTLQRLEESMWRGETRYDLAYMERALAPDFFEFGCSGRVYQRQDTLTMPSEAHEIRATLHDYRVFPLAPGVVLATYVSEVWGETLQRCNRSSIWVKGDSGWQLRFHQGTPLPQ